MENFDKNKLHPVFIGIILAIIICVKFVYSFDLLQEKSAFTNSDSMVYLLKAQEITRGNFEQMKTHSMGYAVILAPFFALYDAQEYYEFMSFQQALNLIFSLIGVLVFFLLARVFMKDSMALLATTVFAFSPHLIANSVSGITEPVFIVLCFLALLLINLKSNLAFYSSMAVAGALVWVRPNGLVLFLALILIAWLVKKIDKKKILIGFLIFLVFLIPYLAQRQVQFDSMFDYGSVSKLLHRDYRTVWVENIQPITPGEFFNDNGVAGSIQYVMHGLKRIIYHFRLLLAPLVVFLLPLGAWFVFRKRQANYLSLIIFIAIGFIPVLAMYPGQGNMRHIFFMIPFFTLWAFIGLDNIIKLEDKKHILTGLLFIGILATSLFTAQLYFFQKSKAANNDRLDLIAEAQYLTSILEGKIMNARGHILVSLSDIYRIKDSNVGAMTNGQLTISDIFTEDYNEFLKLADEYDFNLVYVQDKNKAEYLDDIFADGENYPELKKVYDSQELNITAFTSKVFEIIKE